MRARILEPRKPLPEGYRVRDSFRLNSPGARPPWIGDPVNPVAEHYLRNLLQSIKQTPLDRAPYPRTLEAREKRLRSERWFLGIDALAGVQ